MADFTTKQRDTKNGMKVVLKQDGEVFDLTDKTVCCVIKDRSKVIVDKEPQILDTAGGEVLVNFNEEELDNPGKHYRGEFIVTHDDGTIETFPNQGYFKVEILDNLGGCE